VRARRELVLKVFQVEKVLQIPKVMEILKNQSVCDCKRVSKINKSAFSFLVLLRLLQVNFFNIRTSLLDQVFLALPEKVNYTGR